MPGASVSLDRAILGAGYTEDVRVSSMDGAVVRLRVLSPTEVASISAEAQPVAAKADGRATGEAAERLARHRVLHAACSSPDGSPVFRSPDDVGRFPSSVTRELLSAYDVAHKRTHRIDRAMQVEMGNRARSPDAWVDQFRAAYATQLVAFYGVRSALDTTTAQVIWFVELLRAEHDNRG